ncbi:hypothetical protein PAERUG_P1_London_28_IMP_1_04_05_00165 [Pseudomonas aeruginosa]|nr:hypothetical protein Q031_05858 [Pseudomonas aeruginosa BWHPSA018]CRN75121.1 hypothetical protein PAERUG_P1_London_28_IMP_1_04_05_00165 [Pseudomonas aeruginosa]
MRRCGVRCRGRAHGLWPGSPFLTLVGLGECLVRDVPILTIQHIVRAEGTKVRLRKTISLGHLEGAQVRLDAHSCIFGDVHFLLGGLSCVRTCSPRRILRQRSEHIGKPAMTGRGNLCPNSLHMSTMARIDRRANHGLDHRPLDHLACGIRRVLRPVVVPQDLAQQIDRGGQAIHQIVLPGLVTKRLRRRNDFFQSGLVFLTGFALFFQRITNGGFVSRSVICRDFNEPIVDFADAGLFSRVFRLRFLQEAHSRPLQMRSALEPHCRQARRIRTVHKFYFRCIIISDSSKHSHI